MEMDSISSPTGEPAPPESILRLRSIRPRPFGCWIYVVLLVVTLIFVASFFSPLRRWWLISSLTLAVAWAVVMLTERIGDLRRNRIKKTFTAKEQAELDAYHVALKGYNEAKLREREARRKEAREAVEVEQSQIAKQRAAATAERVHWRADALKMSKVQELLARVEAMPISTAYKYWIEDPKNRDLAIEVAVSLKPQEEIGCVVFGTLAVRQQVLFLTAERIAIVGHEGVRWIERPEVRSLRALPSARGACLMLDAKGGSRSWWEVQPPNAHRSAVAYWKTGKLPQSAVSSLTASERKSAYTYVGGKFMGNLSRRSKQGQLLGPKSQGHMTISNDGSLTVSRRDGAQIAEYGPQFNGTSLESTASVSHSIRARRVLGLGAVALVSPLAAAILTPLSVQRGTKSAFILYIEDGEDSGAFILHEEAFARRLQALKPTAVNDPEVSDSPTPESSHIVAKLERLVKLRNDGDITGEEFERLKSGLLSAPEERDG